MPEIAKSILIADDEPANREIMRAVVEEMMDYKAVLAENGQEALNSIRACQPAIVLIDLMMPVMNGFDAISRLKADSATADIPIIVVSSLSRQADRDRAMDCGASDYVNKPFDFGVLIASIERYMPAG